MTINGDELEGAGNVRYSIMMRIEDEDGNDLESIELDTFGEGMCMGFAGWWNNDFYSNRIGVTCSL